jgi:hypothetical protein
MRALPWLIAILMLACATDAAQAAVSPPVGPPRPLTGPAIGLVPVNVFPFDFHFIERVGGAGFRPGEQVRITVDRGSASPQTVTAGADGSFSAVVSFTWVFCGPNAAAAPPPTITAAGTEGSHARVTLQPAPCPALILALPSNSSGSSTGAVSGGTASGTPVTPPAPEPGPLPDPRLPTPTAQPAIATGFGFAPGEVAQLVEKGAPIPLPAATATADGSGRFRVGVHISVPSPCSGFFGRLWLEATGNRGTSAAAALGFPHPLAIMCPVKGSPGGGTTPPGSPAVPAPNAGTTSAFGLHLGRRTVGRGGAESARMSLPAATAVILTVKYAGGRSQVFHRRSGSASVLVRWHVPRSAGSGVASVTMSAATLGLTLDQRFVVR